MAESQFRNWLNTTSQDTNLRIDCFPYGLLDDINDSIDYKTDAKPFWIILGFYTLLVVASVCVASFLYLIAGKVASAISLLILPLVASIDPGFIVRYLDRKILKLKQIVVTTDRISFISRNTRPFGARRVAEESTFSIPWTALRQISLGHPEANDFNKMSLKFEGQSNDSFEIGLSSIYTRENWSVLSQAIHFRAPAVVIDDRISKALSLASVNTSFTELWLNSLSKAPEHDLLAPIEQGEILSDGRFTVKAELGAGGQGHSYLAYDAATESDVILKEYLLPIYQSQSVKSAALQHIADEANLLKLIKHPQVVELIDWFVESDRAFLVLAHISGTNLKEYVRTNGRPSQNTVRELALQMCEILTFLHSRPTAVIHRDFTPDNLMINRANRLTLIDFNIAEPVGSNASLPPAGKSAYMPPEQFRGETLIESDIYAFGCTLYFLLCAQDPDALQQIDLRGSQVDPTLAFVVYKCTFQDAANRFHSMQEIYKEICPNEHGQ